MPRGKRRRLSRSAEFDRVYREGRSHAGRHLVLYSFPREGDDEPRLGLPGRCKYHPSCSEYAVQSIRTYGVLRGLVLAAWRLLRCNPWSHGGYDPVEAQTIFHIRTPTS